MSANFVFLRSPQEVDLVESMQPIRSRKPSIQLLKFGRTRELPIIVQDSSDLRLAAQACRP
ncbi:hypothetical protein BC939DRAFT_449520 [Gamsiella multidivaricata]|uniref:uncharacterized protein n=1 Tax=Gamsiella multidivaricata TaxID=101098 RepID=UPI00221E4A42|nr:uncharacterized protein BC939DRAFT_449520 [Gamsiella multidivaricata]KAI7824883.1 hypothetical protein BC939DRAFT_449520 [Gamsiella multidivaricata]